MALPHRFQASGTGVQDPVARITAAKPDRFTDLDLARGLA